MWLAKIFECFFIDSIMLVMALTVTTFRVCLKCSFASSNFSALCFDTSRILPIFVSELLHLEKSASVCFQEHRKTYGSLKYLLSIVQQCLKSRDINRFYTLNASTFFAMSAVVPCHHPTKFSCNTTRQKKIICIFGCFRTTNTRLCWLSIVFLYIYVAMAALQCKNISGTNCFETFFDSILI